MRRKQQAQEHVKSPERLPRDPPARISLAFPPQGSLGMESLFSVALRGRSENVALTVRSPFLVFTFRPEMESQADKVCPRCAPTSCSLRKEEAASVYLVTLSPQVLPNQCTFIHVPVPGPCSRPWAEESLLPTGGPSWSLCPCRAFLGCTWGSFVQ